ncbi:MAG: ribose transport system ATP-binding protein [Thermoleophilaceae bacterium]|nr:ribose transport system ATP-binding protein [Thermoleophilaceae bacterium]
MSTNTDSLLVVEGLVKDFGGQRALDRVDFDVRPAEIHALLGENGAGKSTLIKILAGVYSADEGSISIGGEKVADSHLPADIRALGVHFVHQDLGLVDNLSVAENVALETGYVNRHGLVSHRATRRRVQALLEEVGCDVPPGVLVGELRQAERVMVAVARAFAGDARVIVLDEVTASLPGPEATRLAESLRLARRDGVGFVFVTHRITEIFGLADRVTVLRDGRHVATAPLADVDHDQVVEWIVGRRLEHEDFKAAEPDADEAAVLKVEGLSGGSLTGAVSFGIRPGEVFALTGLIGSGASDVAQLLGGAVRPTEGTATLDGTVLPLGDPAALWNTGCAYVPGDRQREGTFPALSVRENLFPGRLARVGDRRVRRVGPEKTAGAALAKRFNVRPEGCLERPLSTLSGGNQQKVVFGRAMRSQPRLLVLDEPTAGVDIGARSELYSLLRGAADEGMAVLLVSSDFEEVAALAERAVVMRHGKVAIELRGDAITRERLAVESYAADKLEAAA